MRGNSLDCAKGMFSCGCVLFVRKLFLEDFYSSAWLLSALVQENGTSNFCDRRRRLIGYLINKANDL